MLKNEELYRANEYWLERIQNDIYRSLHSYQQEENLNQSQLAEKLGYSKGYISQIMNGNFNFSIKKLIDLCLKIGTVPEIEFKNLDEYIFFERRRLEIFRENGFVRIENLNIKSSINVRDIQEYNSKYQNYA